MTKLSFNESEFIFYSQPVAGRKFRLWAVKPIGKNYVLVSQTTWYGTLRENNFSLFPEAMADCGGFVSKGWEKAKFNAMPSVLRKDFQSFLNKEGAYCRL